MKIESRLTFKQLRAFESVYRRRKLAAAADELGITQSAISVLIRQIEETLNTSLFDRTTRSLVPTKAAEDAYAIAERILQDVTNLGSNFRNLTEGNSGRVHLTATPATALTLLPDTVRRFARRYPNIRLIVDDCAPAQFLPYILNERAEFGLGTPPPDESDFNSQELLSDSLQLVCTSNHPLSRERVVKWADLDGTALIVFRNSGYGIRRLIDESLMRAGAVPKVTHEAGFLETATWMVEAGLGVAILPAALARLQAHRSLIVKPLVNPTVTRTLALVTKRKRSLSPSCQLFIDMLFEDVRRRNAPRRRSTAQSDVLLAP